MLQRVQTDDAPAAIGPYSQAMVDRGRGLVFCSGQIGLDPATGQLVEGGTEAEFRRILMTVEAILQAAGCSLREVTRTVLMLTDLADFAAVNAVYAERFGEPFPARTTFQVAALPKGARVEVEVTAVL